MQLNFSNHCLCCFSYYKYYYTDTITPAVIFTSITCNRTNASNVITTTGDNYNNVNNHNSFNDITITNDSDNTASVITTTAAITIITSSVIFTTDTGIKNRIQYGVLATCL